MKIKWLGSSGVIPGKGVVTAGDILDIDERIALSFIKQGLAKKVKEGVSNELRSKK